MTESNVFDYVFEMLHKCHRNILNKSYDTVALSRMR